MNWFTSHLGKEHLNKTMTPPPPPCIPPSAIDALVDTLVNVDRDT